MWFFPHCRNSRSLLISLAVIPLGSVYTMDTLKPSGLAFLTESLTPSLNGAHYRLVLSRFLWAVPWETIMWIAEAVLSLAVKSGHVTWHCTPGLELLPSGMWSYRPCQQPTPRSLLNTRCNFMNNFHTPDSTAWWLRIYAAVSSRRQRL